MNRFETDRTILRWLREDDLDALCELLGHPEVMRFSLNGTCDRDQCRQFLDSCRLSYQENGYGVFAVIEKKTGDLVGYCGFFHHTMKGRDEVEAAYRFHPKVWNRGIGTEVVRAVHRFGFEKLGFNRLIANIDPANHASARVAEKCGMHYETDAMFKERLLVRIYAIERAES